jgi:hypothetical protein
MRKRELARFASVPAADTDTQERGDGEDIHAPGVELTGSEASFAAARRNALRRANALGSDHPINTAVLIDYFLWPLRFFLWVFLATLAFPQPVTAIGTLAL